MNVQTLIPQTAVKRFNKRVICRLFGAREVHGHAVFIRPFIQTFRDKLAAVICLNTYRQAITQHPQRFHHTDNILAFQRLSGMDRQTLIEYNLSTSDIHNILPENISFILYIILLRT